jgi:moderate conductance mechanosensitive channel
MGFDISKGVINISNFNISTDQFTRFLWIAAKIIAILVITKIIIKVGSTILEKFFKTQKESKYGLNERKADTLSELLKSILRYGMYFVAVIWILEASGFELKTVIAVTGVAGVALGFGAQNLVKDIISGFFILFEDQFAVGDYVIIENMSGIVEVVGLRITQIRDFSGDLHIIPNGSITKVTNKSRGNMRSLVDINIAYEEDVNYAVKVIEGVNETIKNEFKDIVVEGPQVLGITSFGEAGVTIRIVAKTVSMKQWEIEMELRKRIKFALDKERIEISYPKRVFVSQKEGKTDDKKL